MDNRIGNELNNGPGKGVSYDVRLCRRACPDCKGPLQDGFKVHRLELMPDRRVEWDVKVDNFCLGCGVSWKPRGVVWAPV